MGIEIDYRLHNPDREAAEQRTEQLELRLAWCTDEINICIDELDKMSPGYGAELHVEADRIMRERDLEKKPLPHSLHKVKDSEKYNGLRERLRIFIDKKIAILNSLGR